MDSKVKSNDTLKKRFTHPLMVDLLLQQIIGLMDVQTLKSARLVCSRWNAMATDAFVSKTRLDLLRVTGSGQLMDLFEYIEQDTSEPFENISISLASEDKSQCRTLGKIIKYCIDPLKDSIRSLHFHACSTTLRDPSSGSPILARTLMLPTSLKSLSISVLPRMIIDNFTVFLKYRKRHLPLQNLREFRIYGRCSYPDDFLELLFADMSSLKIMVLKDPTLYTAESVLKLIIKFNINLKSLRFDGMCFLQKRQIEDLTNISPQLESLKIDFSWLSLRDFGDYEDKCYNLLALTSATLKTLTVNHKRDRILGSILRMPHLPELTYLHLEEWSDFGSLNFMNYLPKLRTLSLQSKIKSYQWINPPVPFTDFMPPVNAAFPQLQKLNLFPITMPDECFHRILKSFPNLKQLSMKGTDSLMKVLYEVCPLIQDLTLLRESQITDLGLTGIVKSFDDNSEGINVNSTKKCCGFMLRLPSIASLTNLRKLQLDGFYSTLTDESVLYGIKLLKNLTSLKLENCEFTLATLRELETLPLMHLDVTNSFRETQDNLWKFVVLAEISQLKIRNPFLHIIGDQEDYELSCLNIIDI